MWQIDSNAACMHILGAIGHGVDFWDNHSCEDVLEHFPDVKEWEIETGARGTTRYFESPYEEAYAVLRKLLNYVREQLVLA